MNLLERLTPGEKRFGTIAIEKGFITKEQLIDALRTQVEEEVEQGAHRFIGSILIEKKAINAEQLGTVCLELGLGLGQGKNL
jgi:hypothetical protein